MGAELSSGEKATNARSPKSWTGSGENQDMNKASEESVMSTQTTTAG
jgi:hypothetical protein